MSNIQIQLMLEQKFLEIYFFYFSLKIKDVALHAQVVLHFSQTYKTFDI